MSQWFSLGGRRCSPLNAALVASEKNAAKAENLGLMNRAIVLRFVSMI